MINKTKFRKRFHANIVLLIGFFVLLTGFVTVLSQNTQDDYHLVNLIKAKQVSDDNLLSIQFSNVTIQDGLEILAGKINVGFSYNPDDLPNKRVSFSMVNVPGHEVLYKLLEGTNLEPVLPPTKDVIILRKKEDGIEFDVLQETVTGTVVDAETGEPLIGVTVIVRGTSIGTTTDRDGMFSLDLPDDAEALIFSYIGYARQEVPIDDQTQFDIELSSDVAGLDDLVVVGYGVERRDDLTGTISEVSSQEITRMSVSSTSEVLQGRVPGLLTKQVSGLPGANNVEMNIRGFGNPLVLVDGIEMSLNDINPNDIESISVLKDASAAIYGSRAGNGVILVTTKRGEHGSPIVNFGTNLSYQQPTRMYNFVNAGQWAEMKREGELNLGLEPSFTVEEVERYKREEPGYESHDWHDATFRSWAPMQETNMSVSGGGNDARYFVSAGYVDQNSAFRSGEFTYQRYSIRGNVEAYITDELTVSLNLSGRKIAQDQPAAGPNAIFNRLGAAHPMYPTSLPDESRLAFGGYIGYNPIGESTREHRGFNDIEQEYVEGILSLAYSFPGVTGLSSEASLSYNYNNRSQKLVNRTYNTYEYDANADQYIHRGTEGTDNMSIFNNRFQWISPKIQLLYQRDLTDHRFSILGVAEYIETDSRGLTATRRDLLSPLAVPYMFAASREGMNTAESVEETGRASFISRVRYIFKDRYRVTGSIRADATHRFPEDSRWGYFPSISASWSLSEEQFFNVGIIDDLRLRASYSQSGSDDIAAFQYLTGYNILSGIDRRGGHTSSYVTGGGPAPMISETGLPNPNITWLEMTTYNMGFDLELWDESVRTEFNVFERTTDNIFGTPDADYPSTFGATLPQLNINKTRDRGFDGLIGYRVFSSDWRLDVSLNAGYSRARYISWSESAFEDEDEIRLFQNEGNYTNRRIGYISDGIFMSQQEIDDHPVDQDGAGNSTLIPGDIRYVDRNGDGEITWRDQEEIGRGVFPDITYGLNLLFAYSNFEISTLFQGASGHDIQLGGIAQGTFHTENNPLQLHYDYSWRPNPDNPSENINPNAILPAIDGSTQGVNNNNSRTSDFWLLDGTYLRLKNLNITYHIPEETLLRFGIRSANVFVSGSNLFTIDRLGIYSGDIDPEIASGSSITHGNYPTVRTISAGFNIGF